MARNPCTCAKALTLHTVLRIIKFERYAKIGKAEGGKPRRTEAKRLEIVEAALALFFEKGYEATSIRMIQQRIGRQVSGFCDYFASKEAVFRAAGELFFSAYEKTPAGAGLMRCDRL